MSFSLGSKAGQFSATNTTWYHILNMAVQYGWEPVGTSASRFDYCNDVPIGEGETRSDWDGGYTTNDYQVVEDEDARNMADALERALPDIPDVCAMTDKISNRGTPYETVDMRIPVNHFEWFSGERKGYLKRFIAFARTGCFRLG